MQVCIKNRFIECDFAAVVGSRLVVIAFSGREK